METEETGHRICQRTMKYFMGIAHHCWVLSHEYIEKSLEAGYYLPEEEYEIQGDDIYPKGYGAHKSRISKYNILQGVKLTFTGDNECFKKGEAEEIVLSLGGQLDNLNTFVVSLDERGDYNTLDRNWLLDSLSLFRCLDIDEYMNKELSYQTSDDQADMTDDDDDYDDEDYIPDSMSESMSEDGDSDCSEILEFNVNMCENNDARSQLVKNKIEQERMVLSGVHNQSNDSNCKNDDVHSKLMGTEREQERSVLSEVQNHSNICKNDNVHYELMETEKEQDRRVVSEVHNHGNDNFSKNDDAHSKLMETEKEQERRRHLSVVKNQGNDNMCESDSIHNDLVEIEKEQERRSVISEVNNQGNENMCENDDVHSKLVENEKELERRNVFLSVAQNHNNIGENDDVNTDLMETKKEQEKRRNLSGVQNQGNDNMCGNDTVHSDLVEIEKEQESDIGNKTGIYVAISKKYEDGSRKWDKKHMCLYCKKKYPGKLPRHFESMHKNELAVQRALAYDKGSKNRKRAWKEITNQGDFENNLKVYEEGLGEIIPCKRPRISTEGTKCVQCKECKGTYMRSSLWRHIKAAHPDKKGKNHQVESASLMPISYIANQGFREKILDKMANDAISIVARNDNDIVTFGQRQFIKHARNTHQFNYVRQKMRELARFLLEARVVDCSIQTLRDCIDALKFQVCVTAVKNLCGYSESSMLFEIPSLANKIGHSLHKVARRVKLSAMAIGDEDLEAKAERFIEMYKEDWKIDVGHSAFETMEIAKYNKPSQIPLADDLKALSVYLKKQANAIMCMSDITNIQWRELSEITLAQTVLFNKRRAGEAERLQVQQYVDGVQHGKTTHAEILESLSPVERKLAEVINRVEVRGKRGRRVAILLQENIEKQFDTLLKHRSCGNIDPENVFMFARPGDSETPIRATDVLRKFAVICGAKQPETLTSTGFRKHVATVSQILNLKENELDVVASFLRHDIRVHREFYRLPSDTIQVAKVSKLLLELERGNISKYKGKCLDEIQFDLDEPLEEENDISNIEEQEEPNITDNIETMKEVSKKKQDRKPIQKNKNYSTKKAWSEEECAAVSRQLGNFFLMDKLPGKHEILDAQKKEPLLMSRPWSQIKFYIKNKKISMKRKMP